MATTTGLGIVCALASEAATLTVRPRPQRVTPLPGIGAMILCGMGADNAERAARLLLQDAPGCTLLSWGLAGALDPVLPSGQLLCPEQVFDPHGARYPCTRPPAGWHQSLPPPLSSQLLTESTLLSVTDTVSSSQEKRRLFEQSGAQAIDMESAAIANVAADQQRPFMVIRAIVDRAEDDIPASIVNAVDQYGSPGVRLARLLMAPTQLLRLPKLARQSALAHRQLRAMAGHLPALAAQLAMADQAAFRQTAAVT